MKYRDHRGNLKESLKTEVEVSTKQELINCINKDFMGDVVDIKFQHVGYDERISWDTYYVLARFEESTEFYVCGMSDGEFK